MVLTSTVTSSTFRNASIFSAAISTLDNGASGPSLSSPFFTCLNCFRSASLDDPSSVASSPELTCEALSPSANCKNTGRKSVFLIGPRRHCGQLGFVR